MLLQSLPIATAIVVIKVLPYVVAVVGLVAVAARAAREPAKLPGSSAMSGNEDSDPFGSGDDSPPDSLEGLAELDPPAAADAAAPADQQIVPVPAPPLRGSRRFRTYLAICGRGAVRVVLLQ